MLSLVKIISGGQTGADQGGLEAGKALKLKTGGWIPKGFRTEDGPRPDLASYGLVEHSSSDYPPRTVANIVEADATITIGNENERGTSLTIRVCGERGRPHLHVSFSGEPEPSRATVMNTKLWLERHHVRVLNVAGNRESINKGIQVFTKKLFIAVCEAPPTPIGGEPICGFFEDNRFLSNFFQLGDPIEFEAEFYHTVEHAFQAAKSTDPKIREMVRATETPGQAKRLGQKIAIRPDWEQVKVGIMKQLLFAKFKDFGLRGLLLATGDRQLIESNTWHDNFWGSCICPTCLDSGQNMLGRLLMEVRSFYAMRATAKEPADVS